MIRMKSPMPAAGRILAFASTLWIMTVAGTMATEIPADLATMIDHDLALAADQLQGTISTLGSNRLYPHSTQPDGSWKTVSADYWTSGFFPGALWLVYEATGDPTWRHAAERWTSGLASQSRNRTTHDVGFMIGESFGNGYRLTGNPEYARILRQAAASLASRYNPVVGATRSWDWGDWQFPVIIDNMMNLELLFRSAALPGGRPLWGSKAARHAATTLANHVRPDGTTFHVVDFDPKTGAVLAKETRQGYADNSTWARGQAWAVYGFTVTYRETRSMRYLTAAQRLADYFIDHLPADSVPYWDFDAPSVPTPVKDSSAAAIAASALVELGGLTATPSRRAKYLDAAIRIVRALSSPKYLAEGTTSRGILRHGAGNVPYYGTKVDVSLIYGDYFFIEALLRLRGVLNASGSAGSHG